MDVRRGAFQILSGCGRRRGSATYYVSQLLRHPHIHACWSFSWFSPQFPHNPQALTNILYHLAAHPEIYLDSLRREVEEVTGRLGWTKAALREMIKVDSFVRESERFNGLSCCMPYSDAYLPKI